MPTETSIKIHPRRPRHQLKGRQPTDAARAEVRALIGAPPPEGHRRDLLIEHLHALNDRYGGLFERHLVALAADMRLGMAEVFEVASFYHHFEVLRDDAVAPRLTVRVCQSLSCQLAGAEDLLARLPALLGADVAVVPAPCIGRCEQAPAALVGQRSLGQATAQAIVSMANQVPTHAEKAQEAPENIAIERYREAGGYALAQAVARGERDAEGVIAALEHAGLRGLGGAGFPAGRKWRIVRGFAGPRLMAVNIDEGEPGTFKDRYYLERDPHRFLEGMLIAAHVVGCEAVYIYLRDEYPECRALLTLAIADLQAAPDLRDQLPKIELRRGAGAYICGEESAMIESIEGKRGEPRLRPPYIAEKGLFGRPTLEHNFETLYWVREILERGPEWFASHGRHGRTGLRSFSVSGRVKNPGVKLAPAGITLRELVDEYCGGMAEGHELYAYLPGGASGGIFPARLADVPLDFDTLQPHGGFIGSAAVMVLGHQDKARDAALNMMRFFADESCGQCTPCRVGTAKAAQLMEAPQWDAPTLRDLSTVMVDASICGLGQAAPNPMLCVQRYFPHEVEGVSA
ncbi:NADH-ubiquinone oxidoreductase-F iron-sulfur binding region domain-containing protein [Ottowia sp.]|uniref:NADH-ubiquinone oxidoreductase-F iron-sulfur binding region domain-containing protein n=1 Tax=Ottowia sp. TaxID=1898956 RepID=UPI002C7CE4EB|nr:NADH-ubiquinone oxidoreductase-F iron-sulfur binding region domain-containing protein [Ottowia sp.]HOB66837.1 NADH-ubiquinone oxidoreductase-F iron-sulfur binding region domain-containing protein [Ottowia sp.]HPZ55895.1 NADH-ubiquinone oxidoreductase-F iron-sulfur binding region domain-containing protein [Ottowia sp.]HQD47997.1 NADH-ubiquinone oxidoreductase-F iron-sulfur binding region domain-containing protein [Ottowia sp.]